MIFNSYEAAKIAKDALEDKKAEDILVLDVKEISNIAECFVIASGSNPNQLRAMASNVEEKLYKAGVRLHHSEGYNGAEWILLDFGELIIHLFSREKREFYSLERIWGDAKQL